MVNAGHDEIAGIFVDPATVTIREPAPSGLHLRVCDRFSNLLQLRPDAALSAEPPPATQDDGATVSAAGLAALLVFLAPIGGARMSSLGTIPQRWFDPAATDNPSSLFYVPGVHPAARRRSQH